MKYFIFSVFILGCADLTMDVHLPDVIIQIGIDGGVVDGGVLDVGIDDIDLGRYPASDLVAAENETAKRTGEETIESTTSPTMPKLSLFTP